MKGTIIEKSITKDIDSTMWESLLNNGKTGHGKIWLPENDLEIIKLDKKPNLLLQDKYKKSRDSKGSHLMFTQEFQRGLAEYKLTNRKIELFCELAVTQGNPTCRTMKINEVYGVKMANCKDKYMNMLRVTISGEVMLVFFGIVSGAFWGKHNSRHIEKFKDAEDYQKVPAQEILEKILSINGKGTIPEKLENKGKSQQKGNRKGKRSKRN